jgi:hypothetical protein
MAAEKTLSVLPSFDLRRMRAIAETLTDAMDSHATFTGVLVVAEVRMDDGRRGIRVYASDLTRLERLGLISEGQDALMQG